MPVAESPKECETAGSPSRSLFKKHLEPTDFADSECRVTEWVPFPGKINDVYVYPTAYRIWRCRAGRHWFQRHEWSYPDRNSTSVDDWIYNGSSISYRFNPHERLATDDEIQAAYAIKHAGRG